MTNAALAQFGVTGASLSPQAKVGRPRVATKIAHIDGDFISYQIAADTKDETEGRRPLRTLEYKMAQIQDIAMEIMERAGAGKFVLHITPSGSTKGGRADQVVRRNTKPTAQTVRSPSIWIKSGMPLALVLGSMDTVWCILSAKPMMA